MEDLFAELEALQDQLEKVQTSSSKNKLSDRNIIEIMGLLQNKHGLLLHYTMDG